MRQFLNNIKKTSVLIFCSSFLFSCAPKVEQGNLILPSDIEKISVGMTTEQVIYVLGAPPMVYDFKNPNNWIYLSYDSFKSKKPKLKKLVISFDHQKHTVTAIDTSEFFSPQLSEKNIKNDNLKGKDN